MHSGPEGLPLRVGVPKNGISPASGRSATFGQSRGEIGRKNLERMIDGAGRDFVRDAYRRRVAEHFGHLNQGAA